MGSKYCDANLQGNGDISNCSCNGAVKYLRRVIKVVGRVLDKRLTG